MFKYSTNTYYYKRKIMTVTNPLSQAEPELMHYRPWPAYGSYRAACGEDCAQVSTYFCEDWKTITCITCIPCRDKARTHLEERDTRDAAVREARRQEAWQAELPARWAWRMAILAALLMAAACYGSSWLAFLGIPLITGCSVGVISFIFCTEWREAFPDGKSLRGFWASVLLNRRPKDE